MTQFCTSESARHSFVAEDLAEFFVAHLGKRRIHHHDQTDGNRNRGGAHAEPVEKWHDARNQPASDDADRHGRENPPGEVAIEKTKARRNCVLHLLMLSAVAAPCSAQRRIWSPFADCAGTCFDSLLQLAGVLFENLRRLECFTQEAEELFVDSFGGLRQAVIHSSPIPAIQHQAGVLQIRQVTGHVGLRTTPARTGCRRRTTPRESAG